MGFYFIQLATSRNFCTAHTDKNTNINLCFNNFTFTESLIKVSLQPGRLIHVWRYTDSNILFTCF